MEISQAWGDETDRRIFLLRVLSKMSYAQIATVVGMTKQGVNERARGIKRALGVRELGVPEDYLSVSEVAEMLSASVGWVTYQCLRGKVDSIRVCRRGKYFLSPQAAEELRQLQVRVCQWCGENVPSERGSNAKYCTDMCSQNARRAKRSRYRPSLASRDVPKGWVMEFYSRLESHTKPQEEEWITLSKAVSVSGLSKNQIYYLWQFCPLSIQDHPTNIRRSGDPERLYATSEMRLAGQIYREWKGRKIAA